MRSVWRREVPVVFLSALAFRIAFILWTYNGTMSPDGQGWSDQGGDIAINMLDGRGYVAASGISKDFRSFRMPMLPLFLFGLWYTFGRSILLANVVVALVSSATCVLVMFLGRRLFCPIAGLVGGLILAALPNHVYWAATLGTEALTGFFLVCSVGLLMYERGTKWHLAGGLTAGCLALTRPVYLPYAALLSIWLAATARPEKWKRTALPFMLAFVATILPWVVRNWHVHGALVVGSTEGGLTFLECNNPIALNEKRGEWVPGYARSQPEVLEATKRMSEVALDRWLYRRGLAFVVQYPSAYARAFLLRIWYLWRPVPRLFPGGYSVKHVLVMALTWLPVFALAVYAVAGGRFTRRRAHAPILLAFLWITITAGLIRGSIRYRAPLEPFIVCYAAAGLVGIRDIASRRGSHGNRGFSARLA